MGDQTVDPTSNCLSTDAFLEIPAAKRPRIVAVKDDDIRDFVEHELAVGARPMVVWQSTFDQEERAEFSRRLDEWKDGHKTDALERVARRILDRSPARRYQEFGVLVALSEAHELVPRRFGAQPKTVYQSHPTSSAEYLPIGGFYRETIEERCHEAIRLMMGLGATRIEAVFDEEALMDMGVDLKGSVLGAGRSASAVGETEARMQGAVTIELPTNSSFAKPDGLRWFDDEPSWRTMTDARLRHGATSYECVVAVHESHGVNAQLVQELGAAHLEVGGSFHRVTEAHIGFKAVFPSVAGTGRS